MSNSGSDTKSVDCDDVTKSKDISHGNGPKKPYKQISDELRKMIVLSIENGSCSRKRAAETFNVPYGSVVSIYKRFLDTGKTCKKKGGTEYSKKLTEEHQQYLQVLLKENCQYTMKQLRDTLQEKFEVDLSITTIARSIPAFIYSVQRLKTTVSEVLTEQQILERKVYCEHFMCVNNSDRLIIYLGEADFKITMRQLARRETPGVGPQIINPTIKHREKTVMVSMTKQELLYYKVVKGPGNNVALLEYFNELFALLDKRKIFGAVIIIDDAIFNRFQEIKEAIEQGGHLLLILTENCPFLNPVETIFSKWTKHMQTKNFRSETEMDSVIGSFKKVIKPNHCNRYCQLVIDNAQKCVSDNFVGAVGL